MNFAVALAADRLPGHADRANTTRRPTSRSRSAVRRFSGARRQELNHRGTEARRCEMAERSTRRRAAAAEADTPQAEPQVGIVTRRDARLAAGDRAIAPPRLVSASPCLCGESVQARSPRMTSRRVFLKNGAFALVSLGFAPSFLSRTAFAQGRSVRGEAAHRDLPARRRRRPERGRAARRGRLLPGAADDCDPAAERRRRRRDRSRRLLRLQSTARAARAAVSRARARHRARVRLARQHALALRRAGLHGDGDARREEHGGRLAESLPAGAARRRRDAVPRRRALGRSCRASSTAARRRSPSATSRSSASTPARRAIGWPPRSSARTPGPATAS